jgi:hypothetical protein
MPRVPDLSPGTLGGAYLAESNTESRLHPPGSLPAARPGQPSLGNKYCGATMASRFDSSAVCIRYSQRVKEQKHIVVRQTDFRQNGPESMIFVEDRRDYSVFNLRSGIQFRTHGRIAPVHFLCTIGSDRLDVNWNHHRVHHAVGPRRFPAAYEAPDTKHRVLARCGRSLLRVDPNLADPAKSQSLMIVGHPAQPVRTETCECSRQCF